MFSRDFNFKTSMPQIVEHECQTPPLNPFQKTVAKIVY